MALNFRKLNHWQFYRLVVSPVMGGKTSKCFEVPELWISSLDMFYNIVENLSAYVAGRSDFVWYVYSRIIFITWNRIYLQQFSGHKPDPESAINCI